MLAVSLTRRVVELTRAPGIRHERGRAACSAGSTAAPRRRARPEARGRRQRARRRRGSGRGRARAAARADAPAACREHHRGREVVHEHERGRGDAARSPSGRVLDEAGAHPTLRASVPSATRSRARRAAAPGSQRRRCAEGGARDRATARPSTSTGIAGLASVEHQRGRNFDARCACARPRRLRLATSATRRAHARNATRTKAIVTPTATIHDGANRAANVEPVMCSCCSTIRFVRFEPGRSSDAEFAMNTAP